MAVVIAVPGNEDQAAQVASRLGAGVVKAEVRQFPDGEIYVRVDGDVRGKDVALVGSLYPGPAERFLTIAFLAQTARDLGARKVGLVAPYLAFMRQDIVFNPGEGVTSKYFAQLVSSTVDWLVPVDPHLHRHDSLDGLYTIPTTIARSAPAIAKWICSEIKEPILVGPDAESVQWVRAVADSCGAPYVILEKTRRGDRDVEISGPPSDMKLNGHTPVLIDDIVSTGRTLIEATRQLRAAGSAAPMCVAIHAVFADADAVLDELISAGAAGIVTCDTIVHASNRIAVCDSIAEAAKQYLSGS